MTQSLSIANKDVQIAEKKPVHSDESLLKKTALFLQPSISTLKTSALTTIK